MCEVGWEDGGTQIGHDEMCDEYVEEALVEWVGGLAVRPVSTSRLEGLGSRTMALRSWVVVVMKLASWRQSKCLALSFLFLPLSLHDTLSD